MCLHMYMFDRPPVFFFNRDHHYFALLNNNVLKKCTNGEAFNFCPFSCSVYTHQPLICIIFSGYGKTVSHVVIGLKTAKGTKQLKVTYWYL